MMFKDVISSILTEEESSNEAFEDENLYSLDKN